MKEWLIFIGGLIVLGVVAMGVSFNMDGKPSVTEPIAFNHQKHGAFLQCTACHTTVATSAAATIPNKDFCWTCHQNKVTDSPEAAKIKTYIDEGRLIPWVRLFAVNDDIVYTHQPHIAAGFPCQTCHGDIGQADGVVTGFGKKGAGGLYGRDLMQFCLDCHQDNKASTDCYTCHK